MNKILLVEDNETLGYILKEYLEMKSFQVTLASNGKAGLRHFKKSNFDLAILDVMMPEKDGFSLALDLKELQPRLPLIFLTAKALKVDKLKGFQLGADDYIVKPVDEEELVARIQAVLRRAQAEVIVEENFEIGEYEFDYNNQFLLWGTEKRMLTEKEAKLLKQLCLHKGRLLSRKQVLQTLWRNSDYFTRRSMDVFISRLRKYLSNDPNIQITNVYGSGFILTDRVTG